MKKTSRLALGISLAALLGASIENAHALTISVSGQGLATAQAAEATFLGGLSHVVTESFEGYGRQSNGQTVVLCDLRRRLHSSHRGTRRRM